MHVVHRHLGHNTGDLGNGQGICTGIECEEPDRNVLYVFPRHSLHVTGPVVPGSPEPSQQKARSGHGPCALLCHSLRTSRIRPLYAGTSTVLPLQLVICIPEPTGAWRHGPAPVGEAEPQRPAHSLRRGAHRLCLNTGARRRGPAPVGEAEPQPPAHPLGRGAHAHGRVHEAAPAAAAHGLQHPGHPRPRSAAAPSRSRRGRRRRCADEWPVYPTP